MKWRTNDDHPTRSTRGHTTRQQQFTQQAATNMRTTRNLIRMITHQRTTYPHHILFREGEYTESGHSDPLDSSHDEAQAVDALCHNEVPV